MTQPDINTLDQAVIEAGFQLARANMERDQDAATTAREQLTEALAARWPNA